MKKKIVSLLITFSLLVSFTVPTFAVNNNAMVRDDSELPLSDSLRLSVESYEEDVVSVVAQHLEDMKQRSMNPKQWAFLRKNSLVCKSAIHLQFMCLMMMRI